MEASLTRVFPRPPDGPDRESDLDPVVEIAAEQRRLGPAGTEPARPWVLTNMISTLDGAISIDGRSTGLGGPADARVFAALRAVADVIIVGATTAAAERYRRPATSDEVRFARQARGQAATPRLAIVSGSLSIPLDLPAFDSTEDPDEQVLVFTGSDAPAGRVEALSAVAEVIVEPSRSVAPAQILDQLWRRGIRIALLEGGPTLNGHFAAAGLIDEWDLTLSPLVVGGTASRAASGPTVETPLGLELARLWTGGGLVFGRWVRAESLLY